MGPKNGGLCDEKTRDDWDRKTENRAGPIGGRGRLSDGGSEEKTKSQFDAKSNRYGHLGWQLG